MARKRVQSAHTAIMHKQEHMRNVEKAGLTSRKPEKAYEKMLYASGHSQSNYASSNHEEDGEDEVDDEEDTELGNVREVDEPGWIVGTTLNLAKQYAVRFCKKQMRLDNSMQMEWGDTADYFHESDKKYGTAELRVPAFDNPHTDTTAATSSPRSSAELMQILDIVPRISQIPHGSS